MLGYEKCRHDIWQVQIWIRNGSQWNSFDISGSVRFRNMHFCPLSTIINLETCTFAIMVYNMLQLPRRWCRYLQSSDSGWRRYSSLIVAKYNSYVYRFQYHRDVWGYASANRFNPPGDLAPGLSYAAHHCISSFHFVHCIRTFLCIGLFSLTSHLVNLHVRQGWFLILWFIFLFVISLIGGVFGHSGNDNFVYWGVIDYPRMHACMLVSECLF